MPRIKPSDVYVWLVPLTLEVKSKEQLVNQGHDPIILEQIFKAIKKQLKALLMIHRE